jgi:D-alanyl-D-alanine endopeptidase (penicillin-binding protein 7)
MLARSHRAKVEFASYRTGSTSGAHRQTVKHHAGKREHHTPVAA